MCSCDICNQVHSFPLLRPAHRSNTNMPSNTDNLTLIAPRPVRLANFSIHLPSHHSLRITSTSADPVEPLDDDSHLDPDSLSPKTSPRASPRLAPPSRFQPFLPAKPLLSGPPYHQKRSRNFFPSSDPLFFLPALPLSALFDTPFLHSMIVPLLFHQSPLVELTTFPFSRGKILAHQLNTPISLLVLFPSLKTKRMTRARSPLQGFLARVH